MSPRRLFAVVCLGLLVLVVPAAAQEKPSLIGQELSPKTDAASWYEERDGKMVRGGLFDTLGAIIIKEAPEYFLVRWRDLQGWVKRDEVLVGAARDPYFADRVQHDPSDSYALRYCAQGLHRIGHINEALAAIDEAIRLRPQDAGAYQIRATILSLGKLDMKGALDTLSVAERIDPANSDTALLRGGIWAAQRDYGKALAEFDRASRLAPNYAQIYYLRAQVWRLQGDSLKAAADLETALRLFPEHLGANLLRANLLTSADSTVNNPKEAAVSARRACELTHWQDLSSLRLLVRACEMAGDEEGARRYREKAEDLTRVDADKLPPLPADPLPIPASVTAAPEGPLPPLPAAPDRKDPLVGSELSPKYANVGWYENKDGKAVRGGPFNNLVGTVVGVAPDYYFIHWRGREGWVKRNDVVLGDERVRYFIERARQNPSDGYAQRVCAQNFLSANFFDTAWTYIERAARLAPNDIAVHHTRAILLALKGDKGGALDEFSAAERIDPSDPMTYALRASLLWHVQKEYDKAAADLDKALQLAPRDETIYFMRAKFWQSRGDHVRALADLDSCLRLWPEQVAAHVERAEMLMKCPDPAVTNPKEAVVSARRACELTRWEDSVHVRRLARACELAGDKEEAARWREKAEKMEQIDAAQLPPLPPLAKP
jgi:tetratricopeptide (TPR) repeat protein